jgi:hypothetical protein
MGATHYDVCKHFAERKTNRDKRASNVYTGYANTEIYSYGYHFIMAYVDDDRKIVVENGDRYGVTTSRHQSELRGALQTYLPKDYRRITVPFSVLRQANVNLYTVEPLDTEADYEDAYCKTHDQHFYADSNSAYMNLMSHQRMFDYNCEGVRYFHRLGGSVFRARSAYTSRSANQNGAWEYFLSGFDETHNSRTDGYFISKLPHPVKTVEAAYEALKPKAVRDAIAAGLDVKRQGDAFAIPVTTVNEFHKIKKLPKMRAKMVDKYGNAYFDTEGKVVPNSGTRRWNYAASGTWSYGLIGKELEVPTFGQFVDSRQNNSHGANEIAVDRYGHIYARGNLYHRPPLGRLPEHKNIPLGKIWHRIVFNTAKGSWQSQTGRVD